MDRTTFLPEFEGRLPEDLPDDALARVARAVREGTFHPGPVSRSQYILVFEESDRIRFRARTLLTAVGIGLNDVTLHRLPDGAIACFVTFYRWFYYCLTVTLVGFAVPAGMLFGRTFGPLLGFHPAFSKGGPAMDVFLCVLLVLGLLWPFALTAMHKPVVRAFLNQLVRRACAQDVSEDEAGAVHNRGATGYEYASSMRVLGLPLVHVVLGPRGEQSRSVAKGVIAVGDVAFGVVFALGGVAVGGISVGGLSLGILSIGGLAVGGIAIGGIAAGLVAVGGLAVGMVAVGGGALGYYAVGGGAIGVHAAGGGVLPLP